MSALPEPLRITLTTTSNPNGLDSLTIRITGAHIIPITRDLPTGFNRQLDDYIKGLQDDWHEALGYIERMSR